MGEWRIARVFGSVAAPDTCDDAVVLVTDSGPGSLPARLVVGVRPRYFAAVRLARRYCS